MANDKQLQHTKAKETETEVDETVKSREQN